MRVLLLGGTAEARALAGTLLARDVDVVSSLAGRVTRPALPPGEVRIGGFGGVPGLAGYLHEHRVDVVVDATHPFAARIAAHAAAACAQTRVALVALQRPGWAGRLDAAGWTWVPDVAAAVVAGQDAQRPFLTTGRQSLAQFLPWAAAAVLARVVDPPAFDLPSAWTLLTSRGPYAPADERAILLGHRADLLVTKDSGGSHTVAKLDAAHELGVPVVVVSRPDRPAGVPVVTTVTGVLTFLGLPAGP